MNQEKHIPHIPIKRTPVDYQDIIQTQWPVKSLRPKMPLEERAKIFLPFAALKGYEESLDQIRKLAQQESIQATSAIEE